MIYESICRKWFSLCEIEDTEDCGEKIAVIYYDDYEVVYYNNWKELFNTVVKPSLKSELDCWGENELLEIFSPQEIHIIKSEV